METLQVLDKVVSADVSADRAAEESEDSGTSCSVQPRFHFQNVSGQKEQRRNKTDFRFAKSQQIRKGKEVPFNISFSVTRLFSGRGLDDTNRPVSGLLPHTCSRIPSMPPSRRLWQGAFADEELALWPLSCPSYLRDHNELDYGNPSFARYEGSRVSRRLLSGLSRPDQIELTDFRSCGASGVSGLEGESREMQLKSMPENGISRNTLEHKRQSHKSPRQESPEDHRLDKGIKVKRSLYAQTDSVLIETSELRQFCDSQGASSLPPPSEILNSVPTAQASAEAGNYLVGTRRVGVVAGGHQFIGSLAKRADHKFFDNGCSRHRMGSPARWIPHSRVMDQNPETMALK